MYEFVATYENMHTEEKRTSTIAFYGYGFFKTEKECYMYAMQQAYDQKRKDECLSNLKFVCEA